MANPDKPDYTHGSTGTKPANPIDYQNGDPVDESEFDYFIHTPFEKIKQIIDRLVAIDSDGDGKVDAAEQADTAMTADTVKGNDIDSDGDGKVDAAEEADHATTADKVKNNDIDSDGDGIVDDADHATTADKVKGNDIDSDGDGKVDAADDADKLGGAAPSEYVSSNGDTLTGDLDFDGNEATGVSIEVRTSDPSNPSTGQLWLRSDK